MQEQLMISEQERKQKLDNYIRLSCDNGWNIKGYNNFNAVLIKCKKCNHTLHGLITVVGGIFSMGILFYWAIIWIILGLSVSEEHLIVNIDEFGEIVTQKIKVL